MCWFPGMTVTLHWVGQVVTLPQLDAFHLVPVLPGGEPPLDLHLLVWEDTLNFRGFQQTNRKDETNRLIGVRS